MREETKEPSLQPDKDGKAVASGEAVFPATLTLAAHALDVDGKAIRLTPGMSLTAEVKRGTRRVIEYLLSPVRHTSAKASGSVGVRVLLIHQNFPGLATAKVMLKLRKQGWKPDAILAHPGWGETLYAKERVPGCQADPLLRVVLRHARQ